MFLKIEGTETQRHKVTCPRSQSLVSGRLKYALCEMTSLTDDFFKKFILFPY